MPSKERQLGRSFCSIPRVVETAAIDSGLFPDFVHHSFEAVCVSARKPRLFPVAGLVAFHERGEVPSQKLEVRDLGAPSKEEEARTEVSRVRRLCGSRDGNEILPRVRETGENRACDDSRPDIRFSKAAHRLKAQDGTRRHGL